MYTEQCTAANCLRIVLPTITILFSRPMLRCTYWLVYWTRRGAVRFSVARIGAYQSVGRPVDCSLSSFCLHEWRRSCSTMQLSLPLVYRRSMCSVVRDDQSSEMVSQETISNICFTRDACNVPHVTLEWSTLFDCLACHQLFALWTKLLCFISKHNMT